MGGHAITAWARVDAVRNLVTTKLGEKGLKMKDASLKMGRAHSFLFQFLKKILPRELHERDRERLAHPFGSGRRRSARS
jgi:hypothetical protein